LFFVFLVLYCKFWWLDLCLVVWCFYLSRPPPPPPPHPPLPRRPTSPRGGHPSPDTQSPPPPRTNGGRGAEPPGTAPPRAAGPLRPSPEMNTRYSSFFREELSEKREGGFVNKYIFWFGMPSATAVVQPSEVSIRDARGPGKRVEKKVLYKLIRSAEKKVVFEGHGRGVDGYVGTPGGKCGVGADRPNAPRIKRGKVVKWGRERLCAQTPAQSRIGRRPKCPRTRGYHVDEVLGVSLATKTGKKEASRGSRTVNYGTLHLRTLLPPNRQTSTGSQKLCLEGASLALPSEVLKDHRTTCWSIWWEGQGKELQLTTRGKTNDNGEE